MKFRPLILGMLMMTTTAVFAAGADLMDPALRHEIAAIRAIDDHTHDDAVSAARGSAWNDAEPLGTSSYPDVAPLRRDDPQWKGAWAALYGFKGSEASPSTLRELLTAKRRRMSAEDWPSRVLDAAGVDLAFVNAAHLGPGQNAARFRWVPFADPLLQPFAGDRPLLDYLGGPTTIAQLMREVGVSGPPADLSQFVDQVIEPVLSRWEAAHAPAIKFLSAYRRRLDVEMNALARAAPVYARAAAGEKLGQADSRLLEDALFEEIAARAGAHRLVVQVHTGNGNGPYFDNGGANPELLEPLIDSPRMRRTRFVLLHGGWPYYLVAQAMTDKPNTYVDFSAQTFYLTTHALAEVLRGWLGWHPEKVLFGTDAYSDADSPLTDYEEKQWLLTEKSRDAVAIALTAMMRDGEITRARAGEIARMVFRDNALQVYRLSP